MNGRWLLLGRPECHLCEQMAEQIAAGFPELRLDWADVDSRDDWRRRWGHKVPVLLDAEGQPVCAGMLDEAALALAMAEAVKAGN